MLVRENYMSQWRRRANNVTHVHSIAQRVSSLHSTNIVCFTLDGFSSYVYELKSSQVVSGMREKLAYLIKNKAL